MESEKILLEIRNKRGKAIIDSGVVPQQLQEDAFIVPSQFNGNKYKVIKHFNGWTCSCPDFKHRRIQCKHIFAVRYWLDLRQFLNKEGLFEFLEELYHKPSCIHCNSFNVVRNGVRKNKGKDKQRFYCNDCKKTFIQNPEFRGLKADAKTVTCVMDLYFKGISFRKIQDHLKQFYEVEVHHETIRRWINKFMKIINNYTNQFIPTTSRKWHSDEMQIKVKGKWEWAWNVLDSETRFLLATNVSKSRHLSDTRKVLREAKEVTPYQPRHIVTDGLQSYSKAIKKEFWTLKNTNTKHKRCPTIRDKRINNNKVERFNGTVRERTKVMRGFKKNKTALQNLENFRTYYNFIRPHQTLNGKTPSEIAGIKIPYFKSNKWLKLIKQGSPTKALK